jgi:pimeloyl-ACP methyl ester carboxylesterase
VKHCRTATFPVTLPDGSAAQLSGEYCVPRAGRTRALQFLVHGATYNHTYWDWPQDPAYYSYVDRALAAGYATLAIDRLGDGASTRPVSTEVTLTATVETLHQVLTAVRAGALGDAYPEIEYVGHSFGSYYGAALNYSYPGDVNAYLLTGAGATVSAQGQAPCTSGNVAADYLPRFASLDSGYLTNAPGTRACFLYYLPAADPAVIAYDQATEDTLALGELTSRPADITPLLTSITAPALVIDGNHDNHYCEPDDYNCSTTRTFYQQLATSFQPGDCLAAALEVSGHDLQLHRTAPVTDALMLAWSLATIPPRGHAARCAQRGPVRTPGVGF